MRKISSLVLTLTTAPVGCLYAAGGNPSPGSGLQEISGGMLMETFLGLLLVLTLIIALGWFMKRYGRLPSSGNQVVKVLGGVSLGPRERAVLLEVEGNRILVGVAPGRVTPLHRLGSDEKAQQASDSFATTLENQLEEGAE